MPQYYGNKLTYLLTHRPSIHCRAGRSYWLTLRDFRVSARMPAAVIASQKLSAITGD